MADIVQQIKEARAAGYKDDEITQYLGSSHPELSGKIQEAIGAGYGPEEILAHLGGPTIPGMEQLGALPGISKTQGFASAKEGKNTRDKIDQHIGEELGVLPSRTVATPGYGNTMRVGGVNKALKGATALSTAPDLDTAVGAGSQVFRGVGEAAAPTLGPALLATNPVGTIAGVATGALGAAAGGKAAGLLDAGPGMRAGAEDVGGLAGATAGGAVAGAIRRLTSKVPTEVYQALAKDTFKHLFPRTAEAAKTVADAAAKAKAESGVSEPSTIVQPSGVTASGADKRTFQDIPTEHRMPFDPARIGHPEANPAAGGAGRVVPEPGKGPTGPRTVFEMGTNNRTPVQEMYPAANQSAGGNAFGRPANSGFESPVPSREKVVFEDAPTDPIRKLYPSANFQAGGQPGTPIPVRPPVQQPAGGHFPVSPEAPTPPSADELKSIGFGSNPPEKSAAKINVHEATNRALKTDAVARQLYNNGQGVTKEHVALLRDKTPSGKAARELAWNDIETVSGKKHSPQSRKQILDKLDALHSDAATITPTTPIPEQ